MKKLFNKNYNFSTIAPLDWTFLKEEEERSAYKEDYNIPMEVEVFATDITGDAICEVGNKIIIIDHSDISSEYCLCESSKIFWEVLLDLSKIPSYSEEEDITVLSSIKKRLSDLKQKAPKGLKGMIKDSLRDLKEQISDLKFEKSPDGIVLQKVQEYRTQLYQLLNRPKKYKLVDFDFFLSDGYIQIYGSCETPDENVEEIKLIRNCSVHQESL